VQVISGKPVSKQKPLSESVPFPDSDAEQVVGNDGWCQSGDLMSRPYSYDELLGMPLPKRSFAFRLVRALFAGIAICYLLLTGAIWYAQTKILFHPNSLVDATPADSGVKFAEVIFR
jgi:hypothetical protein